jgi:RNA polymerase sigma factor (sigma-70 family)
MARALALSLAGDTAEADDLVQEAVLALIAASRRDAARFEGSEHARNYLLRSVRNVAAKARSKQARVSALDSDPVAPEHEDPEMLAVHERQRFLARALRELEPAERELVARRYLKRQTLAHISHETGAPVSTLHSREKSVLEKLRGHLARLEAEEGKAS